MLDEKDPINEKNNSSKPVVETPKKPGLLDKMISKETKMGRFTRSALKILGWSVGMFAVGFFTVFLLLYVPLLNDYEKLSSTQIETLKQLQLAQSENETLKVDIEKAKTNLDQLTLINQSLKISNQVAAVQLALAQKDQPGAEYLLKLLQKDFEIFLPLVKQVDADLANVLQARLSVVNAEIKTDTKAAQMDLASILDKLNDLLARLSK